MDIFDKLQALPPDIALYIASIFVFVFVMVFGAFLVHVAVKHGRVLERKEAAMMRHKRWWEEIK
jgi:hypothetical protein